MVHVPIRGVFLLTKAAMVCVAAACVPVVVKQAKPLAKKLGEEFEKFGKWLQEEDERKQEPQSAAKTEEKAEPAAGPAKPPKKPVTKSTSKKPATKKTAAKTKPKPKAKKAESM